MPDEDSYDGGSDDAVLDDLDLDDDESGLDDTELEGGTLDATDTLDGDPGDDPLDQGIVPPDRSPSGRGERFGTTLAEERTGESLDQLLAEEEPEPDPYAEAEAEDEPEDDEEPAPGPAAWSPRTREHIRTPSPTWWPVMWASMLAPRQQRRPPCTCRTRTPTTAVMNSPTTAVTSVRKSQNPA